MSASDQSPPGRQTLVRNESLRRGLLVLRALAGAGSPITAAELARQTGIPGTDCRTSPRHARGRDDGGARRRRRLAPGHRDRRARGGPRRARHARGRGGKGAAPAREQDGRDGPPEPCSPPRRLGSAGAGGRRPATRRDRLGRTDIRCPPLGRRLGSGSRARRWRRSQRWVPTTPRRTRAGWRMSPRRDRGATPSTSVAWRQGLTSIAVVVPGGLGLAVGMAGPSARLTPKRAATMIPRLRKAAAALEMLTE